MHIVLLGATRRGLCFLERLIELAPTARFTVCSFREEPHEPPFLDALAQRTRSIGGRFFEAKNVAGEPLPAFWAAEPPDLLIAVSWRYYVPPAVYTRCRRAAVVLHDSLLPGYRGFAPTVWALINGEDHTGVTLLHMAEGVDEGDIIDQLRIPIGPDETIATLLERVTQAYLDLFSKNFQPLLDGTAPRRCQDPAQATYTCKRLLEDNRIDWGQPTTAVYNLIRGCTAPYPGAWTLWNGRRLTVWAAQRLTPPRRYIGRIPGRVVEVRAGQGTVVLTGDGALLLTQVQVDGESAKSADEVLTRFSTTLGR